ncbi:MAG: cytidine deaminase [Oscillospiraceae bacterium]|nr:cytidine deaminase [Oscillospiraceae bacterium]
MTYKELIDIAADSQWMAYAPYSGFRVGAAIECSDGTVFTGCNIENAAYACTICAEQVAVSKAVSMGRRDFIRIAIISDGDDYCMPCGSCRQVLQEFAPEIELLCANKDGKYVCYGLKDLLPAPFKKNSGSCDW